MEIKLGKPVQASTGEDVGTVEKLVLDANTKDVVAIILRQGTILTHDRVVDRAFIQRIDPDGTVHLGATTQQVDNLPEFIETEFILPEEDDLRYMPEAWVASYEGLAPFVYAGDRYAQGYGRDSQLFEHAPINPPEIVPESNLPEDTTVVDEATNVVDSEGHKIGTLADMIYDERRNLAGIVVKEGVLFHHDARIPAEWIEAINPAEVRLNVTADQAQLAGSAG